MTDQFVVNADVMLRRVRDSWVLSNPRLRTHVELDGTAAASFVKEAGRAADAATWIAVLGGGKGKDRSSRSFGERGLHADHSGLDQNDDGKWIEAQMLVDLLRARSMLIAEHETGLERARRLSGLLDRECLGSFHERVGQYLLVDKRARESWREWHDQKFSHDGRTLLDSPYRRLQEPFFDQYFSAASVDGLRVLDFGCGNAYFTAKFAQRGAVVTGLDNSSELLEIARANYGGTDRLDLVQTGSFEELLALLQRWEAESYDLIYMQDTLLLLLEPESGSPSSLLPDVMRAFHRLLRPEGSLCAMEPNPTFWLANRYGNETQPYAVVTEYRSPVFNVAPTLDRVLALMARAGFALRAFEHPAAPDQGEYDQSAYHREFPIWDFLVFIPT